MASKFVNLTLPYLAFLALVTLVGFGSTSFQQDRAECADKVISLATCLNYVGGKAKSPPPDCCSGLNTVVEKSPRCLCILIKDRNEPNLGLKYDANLALNLPSACHIPLNLTTCVDLLHLAPNSADAKVFSDFEKSLDQKKTNTTTPPSAGGTTSGSSSSHGSSAAVVKSANNGWKGKRWQGIEIVLGTFILWFFTTHFVVFA